MRSLNLALTYSRPSRKRTLTQGQVPDDGKGAAEDSLFPRVPAIFVTEFGQRVESWSANLNWCKRTDTLALWMIVRPVFVMETWINCWFSRPALLSMQNWFSGVSGAQATRSWIRTMKTSACCWIWSIAINFGVSCLLSEADRIYRGKVALVLYSPSRYSSSVSHSGL